jgi:hypothetical protein
MNQNQTIETEVVYVCSPDFWRYLFLSLRTLLASGTSFDQVTIYVTSNQMPSWRFGDPRIQVRLVPTLDTEYWGTNKCYLCHSTAKRVIYLDTDVMVLKPIDSLYKDSSAELIARYVVSYYMGRYWHPDKWKAILSSIGAPDYPKYSPGFMIFQNSSHLRLKDCWPDLIRQILDHKIPLNPPNRFAELDAFSMACAHQNLTHELMPDYGHRYAMIGESHHDAVVWHLGTPGFYRYYLPVEKATSLAARKDLGCHRPKGLAFEALRCRIAHRLRIKLNGSRDESLEY